MRRFAARGCSTGWDRGGLRKSTLLGDQYKLDFKGLHDRSGTGAAVPHWVLISSAVHCISCGTRWPCSKRVAVHNRMVFTFTSVQYIGCKTELDGIFLHGRTVCGLQYKMGRQLPHGSTLCGLQYKMGQSWPSRWPTRSCAMSTLETTRCRSMRSARVCTRKGLSPPRPLRSPCTPRYSATQGTGSRTLYLNSGGERPNPRSLNPFMSEA